MALFKCKMCGGALEINSETVATCEYCGTQQTLPRLEDDRRANLYDRANHFRRNNDFDKAMGIYEKILNEDTTDAEAYWSLVLCRYGIEYVEDPATHKRIPTVNRAQFTSVFDDGNYKSALQYADLIQRRIYEEEAKAINEIQKGILSISQKEEPFDVFICYKESDSNGRRTPDSVLANELYHQLTQEGFKVFFSRITLEDKLGVAYEPYIFAALNSAKVMVVVGTKPEYFNAVWVRNEWSRYLALIKNDGKKILIPAYRDMDPYDLPEEFSHLQAQDMSRLGFMQDLIRGIKKIAKTEEPKVAVVKETVITGTAASTSPLLKRAFMFLEDGDWDSADEYCEKVLDLDPECAQAYLGKLMAELKVSRREDLRARAVPFDGNNHYRKVIRFADEKLRAEMTGYIEFIKTRNENERLKNTYDSGKTKMETAQTEKDYARAAEIFASISAYQDSAALAQECRERAENMRIQRLEGTYSNAMEAMRVATTETGFMSAERIFASISEYKDSAALARECRKKAEEVGAAEKKNGILAQGKYKMFGDAVSNYEEAISLFESISGWKDADELVIVCREKIRELNAKAEAERLERERKAEADRLEQERQAELARQEALKRAKKLKIIASIACAVIVVVFLISNVFIPMRNRNALIKEYGKEYVDGLKDLQVGDTVLFGKYEQDNNKANGSERIQWVVLKRDGNKALVISRYALDCKPYNTTEEKVTWETCTLRSWLNSTFVNAAFSGAEKSLIPTVTVSADRNPDEDTDPGKATKDKVFLLSVTEANRYFSSNAERVCQYTEYARLAAGYNYATAYYDDCCWWLRTPGSTAKQAAQVWWYMDGAGKIPATPSGSLWTYGEDVEDEDFVRPAMWIDLKP